MTTIASLDGTVGFLTNLITDEAFRSALKEHAVRAKEENESQEARKALPQIEMEALKVANNILASAGGDPQTQRVVKAQLQATLELTGVRGKLPLTEKENGLASTFRATSTKGKLLNALKSFNEDGVAELEQTLGGKNAIILQQGNDAEATAAVRQTNLKKSKAKLIPLFQKLDAGQFGDEITAAAWRSEREECLIAFGITSAELAIVAAPAKGSGSGKKRPASSSSEDGGSSTKRNSRGSGASASPVPDQVAVVRTTRRSSSGTNTNPPPPAILDGKTLNQDIATGIIVRFTEGSLEEELEVKPKRCGASESAGVEASLAGKNYRAIVRTGTSGFKDGSDTFESCIDGKVTKTGYRRLDNKFLDLKQYSYDFNTRTATIGDWCYVKMA